MIRLTHSSEACKSHMWKCLIRITDDISIRGTRMNCHGTDLISWLNFEDFDDDVDKKKC